MAAHKATPLIEAGLAERVVKRALSHGGDFAELFCEQRAGFGLSIDESRIERVQRGAERGAGRPGDPRRDELLRARRRAGRARPGARRRRGRRRGARRALRASQALDAVDAPRAPGDRVAAGPTSPPSARPTSCAPATRPRGPPAPRSRRSWRATRRGAASSPSRTRWALRELTTARGCAWESRWSRGATGPSRRASRRSAAIVASSWWRPARASASPERAAQVALTLLDADPAPAGAMPVVVGGGFGGVLFHEMTGHGLEADHIQKGASVYTGKLGQRVAEPHLDAYDDGRLPGEWGTDGIDDEGTPTQRPPSSTQGRITSYLYDLVRARKDGVESTGNGPARELPPSADPADDQHLHRPRRGRAGGADRRRRHGLLRGLVRRRPGGPDDGRLRVRRLRGLPDRGRQEDQARAAARR